MAIFNPETIIDKSRNQECQQKNIANIYTKTEWASLQGCNFFSSTQAFFFFQFAEKGLCFLMLSQDNNVCMSFSTNFFFFGKERRVILR